MVKAPKGYYYFEAEIEAEGVEEIDAIDKRLRAEAGLIGLEVFQPEAMQEFIYMLDREVNEEVIL